MENHTQPQKRRKAGWILLASLLVLVIAGVALWRWQKNNIDTLVQFSQYSQEELEEKLNENDQKVQEILDAALEAAREVDRTEMAQRPEVDHTQEELIVPPLTKPAAPSQETPEEMEALLEERPAEVPEQELPPAAQSPSSEPQTPAPSTQPTPASPNELSYETQLQEIVDRVYALREEYLLALDTLQAMAIEDYLAIPVENRNASGLASFVADYIGRATDLEKECDGKMDKLLLELDTLLRTYDQNQELVDAVKYTYAQEKSLKKAWYMSELEKRGLI